MLVLGNMFLFVDKKNLTRRSVCLDRLNLQYCFADGCVNSDWGCNCDSDTETSDEGYLTDKDKLPVTGLQFGDLEDAGEEGWFTLGPLICSGQID